MRRQKKKAKKMKLSVNILTWNNIGVLNDTLRNLALDLRNIPSEIIIVDNGSTDGCQNIAIIKNNENLGISIGKNQGIDKSRGEYVLLLDGDILYVPNSANCLLAWLDEHLEEYAIGFYPNKFNTQKNTETQKHHEEYCHKLFEPKPHPQAIIFYGMFRRILFTEQGICCSIDGEFGKPGYGWEDTDFFMQMKAKGITQWAAGLNTSIGKYYHNINSSIRQMGHDEYMRTSRKRAEYFKRKWTNSLTPILTN